MDHDQHPIEDQTFEQEPALEQVGTARPNGQARGLRPVIKPPELKLSREPYVSVLIGPVLESDGTLPLRISADTLGGLRDAWSSICLLHEEVMAKASPINPEAACQIRSRKLAFDVKQRALKHADRALAEIRTAIREAESAIAGKTIPPRGQGDLVGELRAQETRTWLRGLSADDRRRIVSQAVVADDVVLVAAVLERPGLAGVEAEAAAMLRERWTRQRAGEELARLELLQKTSDKVLQAGKRLQRRFDAAYDHVLLDRLEGSTKAA